MTPLRICFLNRIRGNQPGGDMVQLDATVAALRRLGHDAFFLEDFREPAPEADIYHNFHINFGWAREALTGVDYHGVQQLTRSDRFYRRLVITPIFFPDDHFGVSFSEMRSFLDRAVAVTPFSERELDEIRHLTGYSGAATLIPNGTDPSFFAPNDDSRTGPVMGACTGYPGKQVQLIEDACGKELGLPCEIVHGLSHDEMPAAFKRARVFVNASGMEIMSLTTAEALCAGCRVIDTTENRGSAWYGKMPRAYPTDRERLNALIWNAYHDREWDWSPNERARELTWDYTALLLEGVYSEVLAHNEV